MSLTILRITPATDSLVTLTETTFGTFDVSEQTKQYNYKPSDLQEIIITNNQNSFEETLVEIQLTQKVFKATVAELNINGVEANTLGDIGGLTAALQPVFIDSNTGGGGGGTTDNTTPIHFIYKAADGTFRDTEKTYNDGTRETLDTSLIQTKQIESTANDGHIATCNENSLVHQFIVAAAYQKFMELKKINSDTDESFSFKLGQGTQFIDIIKNDGVAEFINIGDINEISDSFPKIFMDKLAEFIAISAGAVIIKPVTNLSVQNLQTYATNALAITGGLSVDDVYKTITGELRIVI